MLTSYGMGYPNPQTQFTGKYNLQWQDLNISKITEDRRYKNSKSQFYFKDPIRRITTSQRLMTASKRNTHDNFNRVWFHNLLQHINDLSVTNFSTSTIKNVAYFQTSSLNKEQDST